MRVWRWFMSRPSEPCWLPHCPLVDDVARVESTRGLEEDDLDLVVGHRPVLDTPWHADQLTRAELDRAVAELHAELPAVNEEQLVLVVVVVPHELTAKLYELSLLVVKLLNVPRTPEPIHCVAI